MSKTLEQKNTRYLLIWLPLVLLLSSLLFYIMLIMHARHMQVEQLRLKQQNIWTAFIAQPASMAMHITGEYDIKDGNPVAQSLLNGPRDTSIFYSATNSNVGFKMLTRQIPRNGKTWQITTYVSSKETTHLIIKVFLTEAVILGLLLLAIVIINRQSSRLLWRPFHATLKKANEYDVVRNPSFGVEQETGTTEFNQLNSDLTGLTHKVNQAYNNQKQFVENASHEMQTPLAIIRSKLELLINDPALTEKNAALLADITTANDRLSQMNKSLLLLAKIENNQFLQQESVNVSGLLEKILYNYQQHYEEFPALTQSLQANVSLIANRPLIEILFSNLVKNAVIHNIPGGHINVWLDNEKFIIENTGPAIEGRPELLFERFKKGSDESKTTGLGLALVKQISQLYHFGLHYRYGHGMHRIEITFRPS